MDVSLTDVYDALNKTLPQEDARIVVGYLENLSGHKAAIDELRHFIKSENAALRADIEKSKSSTIWAFVLLMFPTWTALFFLIYNNNVKH